MNGNAVIGYSASTAGPASGLAISGNVGIGTTGPSDKLQIALAGTADVGIFNTNWAIGNEAILRFRHGDGTVESRESPVIHWPSTCSFCAGEVVPMPTLPSLVIVNLGVPDAEAVKISPPLV